MVRCAADLPAALDGRDVPLFNPRWGMKMRLIIATILFSALCACNPVPPLGSTDKAKFVYELIEDYKTCDVYRQRLSVAGIDSAAIDAIYQEAKKVTCIRRDV